MEGQVSIFRRREGRRHQGQRTSDRLQCRVCQSVQGMGINSCREQLTKVVRDRHPGHEMSAVKADLVVEWCEGDVVFTARLFIFKKSGWKRRDDWVTTPIFAPFRRCIFFCYTKKTAGVSPVLWRPDYLPGLHRYSSIIDRFSIWQCAAWEFNVDRSQIFPESVYYI